MATNKFIYCHQINVKNKISILNVSIIFFRLQHLHTYPLCCDFYKCLLTLHQLNIFCHVIKFMIHFKCDISIKEIDMRSICIQVFIFFIIIIILLSFIMLKDYKYLLLQCAVDHTLLICKTCDSNIILNGVKFFFCSTLNRYNVWQPCKS